MIYDTVVVGTGPSGSVTAYHLARAGFRVLALEKDAHPRIKPCAGCISKRIDRFLDLASLGVIEKEIKGITFTYWGRDRFTYTSSRPGAYMVNRQLFDQALCRRALAQGVEILENCRVKRISRENGLMKLETSLGVFRGRMVVGADGANSVVRKYVGAKAKKRIYLSVERRVRSTAWEECLKEKVLIDIGRLSLGYGWIFPHGQYLSVGLAGLKGKDRPLKHKFTRFLQHMKLRPDHRLDPFTRVHPICSFVGRRQRLYAPGTILVGEAGSLTDPLLGEGIYYAVRSAQLAGLYVGRYFSGLKSALLQYELHVAREFYPEFRRAASLSRIIFMFPRFFYRNLSRNPEAAELFFKILRGEETYKDVFQKVLLWLGRKTIPLHARKGN